MASIPAARTGGWPTSRQRLRSPRSTTSGTPSPASAARRLCCAASAAPSSTRRSHRGWWIRCRTAGSTCSRGPATHCHGCGRRSSRRWCGGSCWTGDAQMDQSSYDGAAMGFHPDVHHRLSIRLAYFDYRAAGAYFVTVCTYERRYIFDDPGLKATAEGVWQTVTLPDCGLADEFVIMPNHVHGIIWITESNVVGARQLPRRYLDGTSVASVVPQRDYT